MEGHVFTVRELRPTDRPALQALCARNVADLSGALPLPSVLLPAPADDRWITGLLTSRHAGTAYPYVVACRTGIVGAIALHDVAPGGHAELTVWVDARVRGRGAATAAVAEVRSIARDSIGLRRLAGAVQLGNGAAHRVLEKNGFDLVGLAPKHRFVAGRWQGHLLFQRLLS